jgi:signal transduction histidine kinase
MPNTNFLRSMWLLILMLCATPSFAQLQAQSERPLPRSEWLDQAQTLIELGGSAERGLAQLPYHWDQLHGAQPGIAQFEVAFELPGEPSEPHAVLITHLGNRFEIWLNGTLISRGGETARSDIGKAPRFVAVPPSLLQKSNLFRVKMEADAVRGAGLSPMLFGLEQPVRQVYEQAYWQQVSAVLAAATLMAVLAVVCLALWITQPAAQGMESADQAVPLGAMIRRDSLYLHTALIAFLLTLVLSDRLIETPPVSWPVWSLVLKGALAGIAMLAGVSYIHLRHDKLARVSGLVRVLPWLMLLWVVAAGLAMPSRWASLSWQDHSLWLLLLPMLYVLVMLYVVVTRFRSASALARELMHSLQARVAQRESELAASYSKLELLAREQERAQERTRILRDMHDGVGAHISAAIRQVQGGQADSEALLQTLRDSLDQLKLSIDSMHLQAGDVVALLANLRYRLEPRFTSSGMVFEWDVDTLPEQPQLDHSAMRQLQYMLFEALSNVLQHAGASTARVQGKQIGELVQISVIDNGRGWDTRQPSRGLASMRERAQAIGAQLDIQSQVGQTTVCILLGKGFRIGA